jgi:hypothetical protein
MTKIPSTFPSTFRNGEYTKLKYTVSIVPSVRVSFAGVSLPTYGTPVR